MAIYHLSVKPVARGAGRSATAAAAYRSGEAVLDRATGEVFDYTRRRGVEHTEIVLPAAAAKVDVNWARDRGQLWNAAEAAEKRRDARVAREYEVALPCELSAVERVALAERFAQQLADRYGCAVDMAVHAPHRSGDTRNHHAHLLATTRQVEPSGLGAKTDIELKDSDRAKKGLGPARKEVSEIREQWAQLANEALRERGVEARVDHRSLEAQGIERVPTTHLGPAVAGLERRGVATRVGERIREQHAAEIAARLAAAAELGRIEREARGVERSLLDLSGDVGRAVAARDRRAGRGGPSAGEQLAGRAAPPPGQDRAPVEAPDEAQRRQQEQAEQAREARRASKSAGLPPAPEVAKPPKRDWNRLKGLQQRLAEQGAESLRQRGVLGLGPGREPVKEQDKEREEPVLERKRTRGISR